MGVCNTATGRAKTIVVVVLKAGLEPAAFSFASK